MVSLDFPLWPLAKFETETTGHPPVVSNAAGKIRAVVFTNEDDMIAYRDAVCIDALYLRINDNNEFHANIANFRQRFRVAYIVPDSQRFQRF